MALNTLAKLLGSTEALSVVRARVRRLRELQTLYFRSAPRELAGSSRVRSYRAGTLVVSADNAAVAAKLKQLAPRVLASIQEMETEITKIRIEVQVGGRARERGYVSRKTQPTAGIATQFDALASRVKDPDLKSALERFAQRRRAEAAALDKNQALDHVEHHHDDDHDKDELQRAPRPAEIAPIASEKKKRNRDGDHE